MKVKLEEREIWIEFAYEVKEFVDGRPGSTLVWERELTTCLLRDASAPPVIAWGTEHPVIARGSVTRYFKDPPNREVARKEALAKALENLDGVLWPSRFPASMHTDNSPDLAAIRAAEKARRKLFWEAYLNRKTAAARKQHGGANA